MTSMRPSHTSTRTSDRRGPAIAGYGGSLLHGDVPAVEHEAAEANEPQRDDRQHRRIDGREAIPERHASRVVVERRDVAQPVESLARRAEVTLAQPDAAPPP